MKTISKQELLKLLSEKRKAEAMTFLFETKKKKTKQNPKCTKLATVNVMANTSYTNKVRKVSGDENFQAQKTYGEKVTNMLVEHNGNWYVQLVNPKTLEVTYLDEKGDSVDYTEPPKRDVEVRRYSINSIREVRANGKVFKVEK